MDRMMGRSTHGLSPNSLDLNWNERVNSICIIHKGPKTATSVTKKVVYHGYEWH